MSASRAGSENRATALIVLGPERVRPAMFDVAEPMDEASREEASRVGRESLEAALTRFTPEQRDAFWNAIGLYYSTRRHPGADEAAEQTETAKVA